MSQEEFTVKDKRRFDEAGNVKDTGEEQGPKKEAAVNEKPAKNEDLKTCAGPQPLPEVNFSTFVFSLSTSALVNLGELPDPMTEEFCQNLALAKQTIDILGMLQEKTQGNLDHEEANLLKSLLYELRMKYVGAIKK